MNNYMINPSIVDLLTKVDNRYSLVTVTSRRARQIIDGDEALVNVEDAYKPLTTALHEVNAGKVSYESLVEGIK